MSSVLEITDINYQWELIHVGKFSQIHLYGQDNKRLQQIHMAIERCNLDLREIKLPIYKEKGFFIWGFYLFISMFFIVTIIIINKYPSLPLNFFLLIYRPRSHRIGCINHCIKSVLSIFFFINMVVYNPKIKVHMKIIRECSLFTFSWM